MKLHLLVLKTRQLEKLRDFYTALGIAFEVERHGAGPIHYAGRVGDLLLELFPLNEATGPADHMIRLGFAVDDLNVALKSVEAVGGGTTMPPQHTDWGYRAVVRDPDGRGVELYQT